MVFVIPKLISGKNTKEWNQQVVTDNTQVPNSGIKMKTEWRAANILDEHDVAQRTSRARMDAIKEFFLHYPH